MLSNIATCRSTLYLEAHISEIGVKYYWKRKLFLSEIVSYKLPLQLTSFPYYNENSVRERLVCYKLIIISVYFVSPNKMQTYLANLNSDKCYMHTLSILFYCKYSLYIRCEFKTNKHINEIIGVICLFCINIFCLILKAMFLFPGIKYINNKEA